MFCGNLAGVGAGLVGTVIGAGVLIGSTSSVLGGADTGTGADVSSRSASGKIAKFFASSTWASFSIVSMLFSFALPTASPSYVVRTFEKYKIRGHTEQPQWS